MSTPERIQRKRTKGWRMPAGAVYVGRPTPWGNPYILSRISVHEWIVLNTDGTELEESWGGRNFAAQYATDAYGDNFINGVWWKMRLRTHRQRTHLRGDRGQVARACPCRHRQSRRADGRQDWPVDPMSAEQDAVTVALRLVESVRAQGRVVPDGVAVALDRFRPNGPSGYRAAGEKDAPVRATRIEAMADWCVRYGSPDGDA